MKVARHLPLITIYLVTMTFVFSVSDCVKWVSVYSFSVVRIRIRFLDGLDKCRVVLLGQTVWQKIRLSPERMIRVFTPFDLFLHCKTTSNSSRTITTSFGGFNVFPIFTVIRALCNQIRSGWKT